MQTMTFEQARDEIRALGDEAHYENRTRFASVNPEAMEIIDSFDTVRQRCQLVIDYSDAFDMAAARNEQLHLILGEVA